MTDPTQGNQAPVAAKRPAELKQGNDVRIDEWYWLREKENPEVRSLLEAENDYTAAVMAPTAGLQAELFDEIVKRIKETDLSVPVKKGEWWYYNRTEKGQQYAIHCRKPDVDGKPGDADTEQVVLDENKETGDSDFLAIGVFDITPSARFLAYGLDNTGGETFTIRIRNLDSGTELDDVIEGASYGSAWAGNDDVLFYVRPDETLRGYQVWRHLVGTATSDDVLIYQEDDARFYVGVGNSKTDDLVVISTSSSLTTEIRYLRSTAPLEEPVLIEPREQGVEYHVVHHRDMSGEEQFFVMTNADAPNYKLMRTAVTSPGKANWQEVIAHRDDVKLDGVDAFTDYLVLSERENANASVAVFDLATQQRQVIQQDEPVYTAWPSGNAEFDTKTLRFEYTSMITPRTVFEYDMSSGTRTVLKRQEVLGNYDPAQYTSERQWATADDGTKIPLSVVYRKDRKPGGPALLYGYGSYEISIDPTFSSLRLSLLDRGFTFAIAHIRGGGDMGRLWYENGKFLQKRNTFTDFIACADHLVKTGQTTPTQLAIRGGSAGGLLMGAVVNLRPDLFGAVVAEVPFVDSLTTMLDESLPATIHEYEEWGNPNEPEFYDYMKSYAPYDNVVAAAYPSMLVTSGFNDPRVSYWEPTKWVQKLRENNTGDTSVLLKTELGAGHQGPSGRYDSWKDEAQVYAFLLTTLRVDESAPS